VLKISAKLFKKEANLELVKLFLDQVAGVIIAILLIVRIETKLEGLTNAIIQLSDVIKPTYKDQ